MRAIYTDLGVSGGMVRGVAEAKRLGQPYEERELGPDWEGMLEK